MNALLLSLTIAGMAGLMLAVALSETGTIYNLVHALMLLGFAGWLFRWTDGEQTVGISLDGEALRIFTRRGQPTIAKWSHIRKLWGPTGEAWNMIVLEPSRPWWNLRIVSFTDEPVPAGEKDSFRKALKEAYERKRA